VPTASGNTNCGQYESDGRLLALLLNASSGDGKAFEQLAQEYRPMLDSAVNSYSVYVSSNDVDELEQEALMAFFRAVRRYDPLYENVSFGLYAKICVENGIKSALRQILSRNGRNVDLVSLDTLEDTELVGPDVEVIEREKAEELRQMIRSLLSDYENSVWWSYYSGVPIKTIAANVGKSVASVENALGRIRRKLKAALK